jgi:hypothetical protein
LVIRGKAAGSTSEGAFARMCISLDSFGKACSQRNQFGSFHLLFLVESKKKA